MNRFINTRQLAFLLFVVIALWVGRRCNQNRETNSILPIQVAGTLQDIVRSLPYRLSVTALCQQACQSISDSSLSLILQYGEISQSNETCSITGRDLHGTSYILTCKVIADSLLIEHLHRTGPDSQCECPTTEQQVAE